MRRGAALIHGNFHFVFNCEPGVIWGKLGDCGSDVLPLPKKGYNIGYNKFSRFCYLGVAKWRFAALAHKFFLVRLMGFAQFALPYFAFFGIAALA